MKKQYYAMGMKGWWIMLVMVIISLNAFGQTTAEDYGKIAQELDLKGNHTEAIILYDKAIELKPDTHAYYYHKAYSYYSMGDIITAQKIVKKIENKFNKSYDQIVSNSNFYLTLRDFNRVLSVIDKALNKLDNVPDTGMMWLYIFRGHADSALRNFDESLKDYKKAYSYDTNSINCWLSLAQVYTEVGHVDSSIYYYNKIINNNKENISTYISLGFLYNRIGRIDEALLIYDKAYEIISKNPSSYYYTTVGLLYSNWGYALFKKGLYDQALDKLNISIKTYSINSYVYRNRALLYIEQKDFDKACDDLNHAIALGFADQYGTEVDDLLKKYYQE